MELNHSEKAKQTEGSNLHLFKYLFQKETIIYICSPNKKCDLDTIQYSVLTAVHTPASTYPHMLLLYAILCILYWITLSTLLYFTRCVYN